MNKRAASFGSQTKCINKTKEKTNMNEICSGRRFMAMSMSNACEKRNKMNKIKL
jgi:hypothetical protein